MRKIRHSTGIWKYLEQCGVLDNGTEEAIQAARRAYKKKYILEYKRRQRAETREFTILLKKDEQKKISKTAKDHNMTTVSFLKTAAMAYISKTYIVPNREQVAHIEQTLIQILNEIQAIAKRKTILFQLNPLSIEKQINRMESIINDTLKNPPIIKEYLKNNLTLKAELIHLLNHDRQNQNTQKTEFQATA